MASKLEDLRARIAELHDLLAAEMEDQRSQFRYRLESGRAVFDRDTRAQHRALRERLADFLRQTRLLTVLSAPFIYALIIPLVFLDLFVSIYQAVCFPVYGIPKVRRSDHIAIDHQFLAYLNLMQKLNCVYCSYANGLLSFAREIAARTEAYWCPIKHSRRTAGLHDQYADFVDYGDADGWRARLTAQRAEEEGRNE